MPPLDDNLNPADELLSAYLDGELSDAERTAVEKRLASDAGARQTLEQLRELSTTLRDLPPAKPNPSLRDAVLQQVEQDLDTRLAVSPRTTNDANASADSQSAGGAFASLPFGRSRRGWAWAAAAVAASLLLVVFSPDQPQPGQADIDVLARNDVEVADSSTVNALAAAGADAPLEMSAASDSLEAATTESAITPDAPAPIVAFTDGADESGSRENRLGAEYFTADPSLLVVRVELRNEAFRRNHFDQVLMTQGITVAPSAAEDAAPASLDENDSQQQVAASAPPAANGQSTAARAFAFATNNRQSLGDTEADVLVVDAPASQFAACLDDLKNDFQNCNAILVCPSGEAPLADVRSNQADKRSSAMRRKAANKSAASGDGEPALEQWFGYNRSGTAGQAKAMQPSNLAKQSARKSGGSAQQPARAYRVSGSQRQQLPRSIEENALSGGGFGGSGGFDSGLESADGIRSPVARDSSVVSESETTREIPPPTDESSRVQAIVIVEAEDAASEP
ncbi:MAG: zf-HC2 domain-containing protein [Planctomycetota bacterium]